MKKLASLLILLLIVLHQDFWWWHTHEPLVLGFIPIGLAWHVGISVAAGLIGLLVVKGCWPVDDGGDASAPSSGRRPGGAA